MKIRTQFDPNYKGTEGEINTMPSMTVPDMTLTMRQLMENHTRGISSNVKTYEPQYFEEQEIPNITDLTDYAEQRRLIAERRRKTQTAIDDERDTITQSQMSTPHSTPKPPLDIPSTPLKPTTE